jgi:hypothetical protein
LPDGITQRTWGAYCAWHRHLFGGLNRLHSKIGSFYSGHAIV